MRSSTLRRPPRARFRRLILLALVPVIGCSSTESPPETAPAPQGPLDHLPDDRAGDVVRRSIAYAGGWNAYASTRTVTFLKTHHRYAPDGTLEGRRAERHAYVLRPRMHGRIEFEEDGRRIALVNDGYFGWMLVNGELATSPEETNQARNSTFGSHYVFHMPFKLADSGVQLEWLEQRELDGVTVDAVRVTYGQGVGDAGGLHTWTYFFDAESARLVANHLAHADGFSWTEYLDDAPVGGMRLSTRRYGYAADADVKVGPRTSEIVYEEILVNSQLDEAGFTRPPGVPGAP